MKIFLSSKYLRAYKKLIKKKPQLHQKVKKKLEVFKTNPRHSSLKLHKLEGGPTEDWSIVIEKDIRLLVSYTKGGAILTNIGSHDEVY